MTSEIASYIGHLLYEHDAVIVPQLGGFVTTYKSAAIDHVQGILYPPSKNLSFNENLVINDGVLINYIRKRHGLSAQDARSAVEQFVEEVKKAVGQREIVVFPEVGRLYQDYEQSIQFLPDSTNYNTDVFGLPTVQFYPILRSDSRDRIEHEKPPKTIHKTPHYIKERKRRRRSVLLRQAIPYAIAGIVVLSAVGLYTSLRNSDSIPSISDVRLPTSHNLNVPPSRQKEDLVEVSGIDEDEADALTEAEIIEQELKEMEVETKLPPKKETEKTVVEEITEEAPIPPDIEEEEVDTEGATKLPNQKVSTIIVHSFGNKDNVRRMTKKLVKMGYNVVTDKNKGLTRVGVKIVYEKERELQRRLKRIKRQVNKGAYIK